MADAPKLPPAAERMLREVESKRQRILRARGSKNGILSSLLLMGAVGWSVTIPTLLGAAFGIWIDKQYPSRFSWAAILIIAGLLLGCVNAWRRLKGDHR
jgi:ATP synthase protein I